MIDATYDPSDNKLRLHFLEKWKLTAAGIALLGSVACGGPTFSTVLELHDAGPSFEASFSEAAPDTSLRHDAAPPLPEAAPLDTSTPDTFPALETSVPDSTPPDTAPLCSTPASPLLTGTQGLAGGIQFHVTADTTLTAFTFTGALATEDTATLTDDQCNPIASASMPNEPIPGYAPFTVQVHWLLHAGTSYRLVSTSSQTAYSTAEGQAPYTVGMLVVEAGLVSCPGGIQSTDGLWTGFTNLTFCP